MEIDSITQKFINRNKGTDMSKIAFQRSSNPDVNYVLAIQQIEGLKKAKVKFPSLIRYEGFIFPSTLAMEQCSSEYTAKYKAQLVEGGTLADITGGLGIDTLFMSERASSICYIEQNEELCEIAKHNFEVCKKTNIQSFCEDSIFFLQKSDTNFDYIYLDPARRDKGNKRMTFLSDCMPNVLEIKRLLFSKTPFILLKTSPMLDINKALADLQSVSEVHIVAVKNECKELLFCVKESEAVRNVKFVCVNIQNENEMDLFEFLQSEENDIEISDAGNIARYLYEPNSAILKAGGFKIVAARFGLKKLHQHSHLYTSDSFVADFYGKIFEVQTVFSLNEKELKIHLPGKKANVVVRNYPMPVKEIRKKFRITDGNAETFLFATTIAGNKKVGILCKRKNERLSDRECFGFESVESK